MDAAKPDWCSLPHFLLQSISERFHSRVDILRFRAVCGDFRALTPLPSKITSLKIPVPVELNPIDGDHLLLSESIVYAIQPLNSTETWLVKAEETSPGKLLVFDLFCRLQVKRYSSNKLTFKSLNLLDYRVNEISKRHGFQLVSDDDDKAMEYSGIESSEDLFLIDYRLSPDHYGSPEHYVSDTSCILKIDKEKRKLVKVNKNALKDRVFFVGYDCSFSISAKEYSECKENCIYLTRDEIYSGLMSPVQSNNEQLFLQFLRDVMLINVDAVFGPAHCNFFYAILRFFEAPI
ncbi:hypothetical protein Q3G72_033673 [Acer saccharum]|nr:hypothetical protein Q3G72_033673 [Acer saccharum]